MRISSFLSIFLVGAWVWGCNEDDAGRDGNLGGAGGGSGGLNGSGGASGGSGGGDGSGGAIDLPPNWRVEGLTTWRGDAQAAYTIVHDDTCQTSSQQRLAVPALNQRGLHASFGAIVESCGDQWSDLRAFRSAGHEVMNHSWSHENLNEIPYEDALLEISRAEQGLESNLSGHEVEFFIFPYDSWNDGLLAHLRDKGYTGARGGARGINPGDFTDDFRLQFDVYGPGYSIYRSAEGTPCASVQSGDEWDSTSRECRLYVMNRYVDDVIAQSGYGIRELHGLEGNGWEPLPVDEYEEHLDYVLTKIEAKELWMETASTVIRYRRARDACALPSVSGDTLRFDRVTDLCRRYATALSFRVAPLGAAPAGLEARQAGELVTVRDEGDGTFLIDADPALGDVTLSPR